MSRVLLRVLGRPPFRLLLGAQIISIAGDRLNYLALVSLLTAHAAIHGTSPATALSALAWAMLAPSLIVSPWAGAIVDRLPLVRVLVVSDAARAITVAAIPAAYAVSHSEASIYALVALAFTLNCFFLPARSALPPHLVPEGTWSWANAILVLGGLVATVLGSSIGGPLVDAFGPAWALYADAVTYLASVIAFLLILRAGIEVRGEPGGRKPSRSEAGDTQVRPIDPAGGEPNASAPARALRDIVEGWRWFLSRSSVRLPILAAAGCWLGGGILHVAGALHVQRGTTQVTGIGILLGAFAIGAAVGTALVLSRERERTIAPAARARTLGIGLLGAAVGLAAFAASSALVPMALAAIVTGGFAAPIFFLSETALQESVPVGARARVFSARDFIGRASFLAAVTAAGASTKPDTTGSVLVLGAALVAGLGLLCILSGASGPGLTKK